MCEPSELDDLVVGARAGNEGALSALYREFQPALLGFLTGLVPGEAEDLAAETWIDVVRILPKLEGGGAGFRRLLFTVARRRAIDHGRTRRRRRTELAGTFEIQGQFAGGDPAEVVTNRDAARLAIDQIRALLSDAQAEVVILRVLSGLSVAEVARIVGRRPTTVSVLQTRGLQRLAAKLGETPGQAQDRSDDDRPSMSTPSRAIGKII
jgi:RNA polymerase sigma-70 factor (ECF subfamily)